jgi:thioredoxin 1
MALITLTKENFEAVVLKANKPVLVDFWATWCAPCRMLSPIVDEIAEENDAIIVGQVNVDEQQELSMQYRISSIPTLLVFENGQIKNKNVGVVGKSDILKML